MTSLPGRLRSLTNSLPSLGIDALLVTDVTNVRYLSGFTGDSSYLFVEPDKATILSDGRYETQIASQCIGLGRVIRPPQQLLGDLTQSVLNDSGHGVVGIEAEHVSMLDFHTLVDRCPSIEFVATTACVEKLRMIKDAAEIELTRTAVRIAERSFESVVPLLTTTSSERSIAHELEANMRRLGADGCSFPPIVAVGDAGALPHYHPGDRVLADDSTLLIDWGASYCGYASDLTRTLHRSSAGAAFRRAYEAVLEAQLAAIDAIGPGVSARDVDAIARGILERAGMGDAFKHGLGHGTGLQIHEAPRMSSRSEEELVSGMIVTVEPGVYFANEFGIRIEDDVLVHDSGREVLSRLPKGLDECGLML